MLKTLCWTIFYIFYFIFLSVCVCAKNMPFNVKHKEISTHSHILNSINMSKYQIDAKRAPKNNSKKYIYNIRQNPWEIGDVFPLLFSFKTLFHLLVYSVQYFSYCWHLVYTSFVRHHDAVWYIFCSFLVLVTSCSVLTE